MKSQQKRNSERKLPLFTPPERHTWTARHVRKAPWRSSGDKPVYECKVVSEGFFEPLDRGWEEHTFFFPSMPRWATGAVRKAISQGPSSIDQFRELVKVLAGDVK